MGMRTLDRHRIVAPWQALCALPALALLATLTGCDIPSSQAGGPSTNPGEGDGPAARATVPTPPPGATVDTSTTPRTVRAIEDQWREHLSDMQFHILREHGTERAGTGPYSQTKAHPTPGTYYCAGCGLPLFDAAAKFDSGTGWPSFTQPIDPANVRDIEDNSLGMTRIENRCASCDGHLGHVFPDGPSAKRHRQGTGLRYCINGHALVFVPDDVTTTESPHNTDH